MRTTQFTPWISALFSLLCLMAGFGLAGYWEIILIIPVVLLYWLFTRKSSRRIVFSILLVAYVLMAALGLLIKLSPYLMLIGCSLALIGWESALFLLTLDIGVASDQQNHKRLEALHLRDLTISSGCGLLLGLIGLNFHLHLSFGLIVGLALLVVYGFYRWLRYLMK